MAPMTPPTAAPDQNAPVSPIGQQIAAAVQKLPVDDLTTLMHGISLDALEVMEKIPELSAFADFIENGGKSGPDADDQPGQPAGKPGIAIMIGVGKPRDPRADVARAAAAHGMK